MPLIFYSPELFKPNGEVEELPYASAPVPCYIVGKKDFYLKNGEKEVEYNVVPMWDNKNINGITLSFDSNGRCTNKTESIMNIFSSYSECERFCQNTLNPYIIDVRLKDWQGRAVQLVYDKLIKEQAETLKLAKNQNEQIAEIFNREK